MKENGRINLGARGEHHPPAGFRHSCGPFDLSRVSMVHLSAFSQLNFDPHVAHSSGSQPRLASAAQKSSKPIMDRVDLMHTDFAIPEISVNT